MDSSSGGLGVVRPLVAAALSILIALRSWRKKSLSTSGAVAGAIILTLSLMSGLRFGAVILAFFFSSSHLTKYKSDVKQNIEEDFKQGGQRDWTQVVANGGVGTVVSVGVAVLTNWQDSCLDAQRAPVVTALLAGLLGHYACCNGDTWSSELGVLSKTQPRLITSFKPVPRGTNGGVSVLGTAAAAAGGTLIGLVFVVAGLFSTNCQGHVWQMQWLALPLGTLCGLLGSVLDSFLGATVQFSGMCKVRKKVVAKPGPTVQKISGHDFMTNTDVNFASGLVTALAAAAASRYIF
jgi:uncharacterized protein (TIGR00297 family)